MALIKCKDCKREISSAAKACPHCGKPVPHIDPGDVVKVVGGLLIAWGIYHVFSSSDSPSAPVPPAPTPAAFAPAPPLAAREPSFDCNHAHSQSERLICADAELSALDADFGTLYKKAKNLASDKAAFVRANRSEWQRRENACFDKACLIDWYAQRNFELLKVIVNAAAPLNDYPLNGAAAETVTTDGEKENRAPAVLTDADRAMAAAFSAKLEIEKIKMATCLQKLPVPLSGAERQVEKVIRAYVASCGQDYVAVWRQLGEREEMGIESAVLEAFKAAGCRVNPTQADLENTPSGGRSIICSASYRAGNPFAPE